MKLKNGYYLFFKHNWGFYGKTRISQDIAICGVQMRSNAGDGRGSMQVPQATKTPMESLATVENR